MCPYIRLPLPGQLYSINHNSSSNYCLLTLDVGLLGLGSGRYDQEWIPPCSAERYEILATLNNRELGTGQTAHYDSSKINRLQ